VIVLRIEYCGSCSDEWRVGRIVRLLRVSAVSVACHWDFPMDSACMCHVSVQTRHNRGHIKIKDACGAT
jgi:hypothetical protein